jgi:hypothetical protein
MEQGGLGVKMNLLLYARGHDRENTRLEAAVHSTIPKRNVEPFKRLDDFTERLRWPVEPDSIAVIAAADHEELRRMQTLRKLLPEIYVVLVIPDRKKSTIDLAHLLLPRFLSQRHEDFTDLGEVLKKMYKNSLSSQLLY